MRHWPKTADRKGGYASVNRFARNGGRSLGSINPQNTEHIKVTAIRRTASQVKCSCSADIARQVTFRRLSAVDGLHVFILLFKLWWTSLLGCMRLLDMLVCAFHLLCAFRVWTYGFAFLYVNEFLTSACGISPLRGRPNGPNWSQSLQLPLRIPQPWKGWRTF